jgi:hypothetical protein
MAVLLKLALVVVVFVVVVVVVVAVVRFHHQCPLARRTAPFF